MLLPPFCWCSVASGRALTLLLLAALTGCSSPIRKDAPLVGRWSTGCVMSQLGPSMSRYTFRSDETFDASFAMLFMRLTDTGSYRVDGDVITFTGKSKAWTMRFDFKGDHLMLRDSDTYTLHKIGNAK